MLSLDLVDKGLVTDQLVITVSYDRASLADGHYKGEVTTDYYGRSAPKHAHGTANLDRHTASTKEIVRAAVELFEHIVDKTLLVRRLNITAGNIIRESDIPASESYRQLSLFDVETSERERESEEMARGKERALQDAILDIKRRFGKNAVLKGKNLSDGATAKERNKMIGGHKS